VSGKRNEFYCTRLRMPERRIGLYPVRTTWHRAVFYCRLSLRESSVFSIFRRAKSDSYFPHDAWKVVLRERSTRHFSFTQYHPPAQSHEEDIPRAGSHFASHFFVLFVVLFSFQSLTTKKTKETKTWRVEAAGELCRLSPSASLSESDPQPFHVARNLDSSFPSDANVGGDCFGKFISYPIF